MEQILKSACIREGFLQEAAFELDFKDCHGMWVGGGGREGNLKQGDKSEVRCGKWKGTAERT